MPAAKNLIGQKFGHLTVIGLGEHKGKRRRWKCLCDCEKKTIIEASTSNLTGGNTTSCGCSRKKGHAEDLTGQKFGKWLVLERKDGEWLCECECGTKKVVAHKNLKSGMSQSCGKCKDNPYNDLTGKVFGLLTVIEYAGKGKWRCLCSCGKEKNIKGCHLVSGHTKSCGCIKKEKGKVNLGIQLDLTDERHGRLVAKEKLPEPVDGCYLWRCECDCGNKNVIVWGYRFHNGYGPHSCGCDKISQTGSRIENEIKTFVESFGHKVRKARRILDGKEIDIYIEELNLGIEYNGSAYHASENGFAKNKDKKYHYLKFETAKKKGIHLITIFDVDWKDNQDKIKMYLKYLLGENDVVYARNTEVRSVLRDEALEFVNKYHIKGASKSIMQINYGLYEGGELLSIMGFGSPRMKEAKDGYYELHRYCVKDGYKIIGGAQKLLKCFERNHNPVHLLSYSDNDYFTGGMYEKLGFNYDGQATIPYYWCLNGNKLTREQCQLSNLKTKYPNEYNDAINNNISGKEDYIMTSIGACKVYRSGNTRWIKEYKEEL